MADYFEPELHTKRERRSLLEQGKKWYGQVPSWFRKQKNRTLRAKNRAVVKRILREGRYEDPPLCLPNRRNVVWDWF